MPESRDCISVLTISALIPLAALAAATSDNRSEVDPQRHTVLRSVDDLPRERLLISSLVLQGPLKLSMTPESAQRDANVCQAWNYKETPVKQDLLSMRMVSAADWGRYCYQYACSMNGEAEVKGMKYRVEVNAGGWISLTDFDGTTRYWASSKRLPGFIAACDCCE